MSARHESAFLKILSLADGDHYILPFSWGGQTWGIENGTHGGTLKNDGDCRGSLTLPFSWGGQTWGIEVNLSGPRSRQLAEIYWEMKMGFDLFKNIKVKLWSPAKRFLKSYPWFGKKYSHASLPAYVKVKTWKTKQSRHTLKWKREGSAGHG